MLSIKDIESKPTLDTNIVGLNSALDADLALLQGQIRAINQQQYKRTFTTLAQLGLAADVTVTALAKQLPNNSFLELDAYRAQHVNLVPSLSGNLQSGLLSISSGSDVNKRTMHFQNDAGAWVRTLGGLSTASVTDTGWRRYTDMQTYHTGEILGLAFLNDAGAKQGAGLNVQGTSKVSTGRFQVQFNLPAGTGTGVASWTIFSSARSSSPVTTFVGTVSISGTVLTADVWVRDATSVADPTHLFVQLVYNGTNV